jgi:hypothetical protein
MTPAGQVKADRNGVLGQAHVLGIERCHSTIDGDLGGVPVEVKTCEAVIKNGWRASNGKPYAARLGRFHLSNHQHNHLVCLGGDYAFVVVSNGRILGEARVPAQEVEDRFTVSSRPVTRIPYTAFVKAVVFR